ncbi:LytR/AlgR family response regulator transcription factor [Clostridium sp.]|uniref:LytR/AlgR family response regulator transcription factor n=1 Tax=Clostridium sp. TaxID=1506 RepID=UPI003F30A43A
MIKIAICEDEKIHQELLTENLKKLFRELSIDYEVYIFDSGEQLLENYPENIDIFLLDIQMDKLSGMDIARKIRTIDKNTVEIVFTTSLIEYIQEGYEVRAYRYLLKPIEFEDIKKHITACIEEIHMKKDKYLVISNKHDNYKIRIDTILYIEVQNKDITIHTIDNNYEAKMSMNKIEKELKEYSFFRCHKSFLININFVENVKQYTAILENGQEVPVSRYKFKEFKTAFLKSLRKVL